MIIHTDSLAPNGSAVTARSPKVLAERALTDPSSAISYVFALLKGYWYRAIFRLLGRRFRAGAQFRVFGSLSVRGPGDVVFGENVALWGRVNAWTYSRDARIIVEDNVMMSGTRFACACRIRVGRDSILADASIRDTDFHSTRADRRCPDAPIRVSPVEIGENVWIAANAVLLPGTSIGENSVVGAAAVCMRSFPANKVILGNPARVAMPIPSIGGSESPDTAAVLIDDTDAVALPRAVSSAWHR